MLFRTFALIVAMSLVGVTLGQEETTPESVTPPTAESTNEASKSPEHEQSQTDQLKETAKQVEEKTVQEVTKIAKQVDQDPRAKTAAAGILQPIYVVAEKLAFPAFHWIAFSLMSAGVVSYVLQLVLGKLVVLTRLGFSVKEIVSDAVGLAISIVGLVLTTQASAENSTFTQSPAAVISATAVGVIVGFILYLWGQSQELDAVAGRSQPVKR
jgi:hypothetical protein